MLNHGNVHVFTNEDGNNTSLSSNIWSIIVEHFGDIRSDCSAILFNLLLIVEIWVVCFSDFEELVRDMKLIMIIIITPLD